MTLPPTLSLHCHGRHQESMTALKLAELRQDLRILYNTAFQVAPNNPSVLAFILKPISARLSIFLNTLCQNIEMDLQRQPLPDSVKIQ